jgi:hypothetical protein
MGCLKLRGAAMLSRLALPFALFLLASIALGQVAWIGRKGTAVAPDLAIAGSRNSDNRDGEVHKVRIDVAVNLNEDPDHIGSLLKAKVSESFPTKDLSLCREFRDGLLMVIVLWAADLPNDYIVANATLEGIDTFCLHGFYVDLLSREDSFRPIDIQFHAVDQGYTRFISGNNILRKNNGWLDTQERGLFFKVTLQTIGLVKDTRQCEGTVVFYPPKEFGDRGIDLNLVIHRLSPAWQVIERSPVVRSFQLTEADTRQRQAMFQKKYLHGWSVVPDRFEGTLGNGDGLSVGPDSYTLWGNNEDIHGRVAQWAQEKNCKACQLEAVSGP